VAYAFQIITEKSAIALHGDVAQLGHVAIYHGACCSQIDNLHAVLEIFQIGQKYLFLLKRQKKREFYIEMLEKGLMMGKEGRVDENCNIRLSKLGRREALWVNVVKWKGCAFIKHIKTFV
jgi:hypothetical protein